MTPETPLLELQLLSMSLLPAEMDDEVHNYVSNKVKIKLKLKSQSAYKHI